MGRQRPRGDRGLPSVSSDLTTALKQTQGDEDVDS
jgi:hypothetical protein